MVIDIDEDPATIEGCTLNFTVYDARDVNGNYSDAVLWSAFVNCKQLAWKDDVVDVEQHLNTGSSLTATLVNKGGKQQAWSLSGLPSWITTSSEYGTTNPLAESAVTFNIAASAPLGRHEVTIYATDNDNISVPLTLNVKVTGEEPDWAVNTGAYAETMNLIGSLKVLGVPSQDEDDIVGVFIGEECRGVANAPLELKFVANDFLGVYKNPVVLNATDMIEQNIELAKGWNWMSLSVQPTDDPADMTTDNVFTNAAGRVTLVKYLSDYDEYDAADGWFEMEMDNAKMYLVSTTEPFTLNVTGHRVKPAEVPIAFNRGWNWIGYNGQQVIGLADALSGMQPKDGDIIKGQKGVAYFDEYEWIGSLRTLVPGKGYKAKNTGTTDKTFTYPASAASSGARLAPRKAMEAEPTVFTPVDYHSFAENMVVIAQVVDNGQPVEGVEVGFYAGNECREAAVTNEKGLILVTVPGNGPTTISIRVSDGERVMTFPQTIDYETDAVVGTPGNPFAIEMTEATGIETVSASGVDSIYDIAGRKIDSSRRNTLHRGVYIINGQKTTVK